MKYEVVVIDTLNALQNKEYLAMLDKKSMVTRDKWRDFGVNILMLMEECKKLSPQPEIIMILGDEGQGKAQPLSSIIKTPNGNIAMGAIYEGCEIFASDGSIQKVLQVHPQGFKQVYEVIFNDGSKTRCCKEHLWFTQTLKERAKGKGSVKSLEEIMNTLVDNRGFTNHYIPMTDPVQYEYKDYIIPPYTMGVLLGDGGFTGETLSLTNPDEFVINRVANELKTVKLSKVGEISYNLVRDDTTTKYNDYIQELKSLGLFGSKSIGKFIPKKYLYGSINQRLELLAGLVDTDGYTNDSSSEYSTSSKQLKDDFIELVESLGGTCLYTERIPKYKHNDEEKFGQISYRLRFKFDFNPFYLPRKREKFVDRSKYKVYRNIKSIEPVGIEECQCITVSSKDNLYLTDRFIVTHNSFGIKTLNPETTLWIHADNKPITFKGGRQNYSRDKGNYTLKDTYEDVEKMVKMAHDNRVDKDAGLFIFMLAHTMAIDTVEGDKKLKLRTLGNFATKMNVEGAVTNCFYTDVMMKNDKPVYRLRTQTKGNDTARSLEGLFDEMYIPNDYQYIIDAIKKY